MDEEQLSQVSTQQEQDATLNVPAKSARTRRTRHIGASIARVILIVLLGIGFFLSVTPWGQATLRTALLIPALVSASEPAPLTWFSDPIRFTRKTISSRNGPVFLDIYEPTSSAPLISGKRAALINIVGVGDNRNDEQIVNLSRAFARQGVVVVNMGTPLLFNFVIATQDSDAVVQTFNFLTHYPGVDARRIGIFGISAGSTLACLAAADPRIRDKLAYITLFGGYFDATTFLQDIGHHALLVDGRRQPWQPNYVPTQVLADSMSSTLSPTENSLFQQMFIKNGTPLDSTQLSQLSPAAAAVYHLLAGDEPAHVEQNMAALSPQMRVLLWQLSPISVVDQIHTPIYLLHSRNDEYVPFTQSRQFATDLTGIHHVYDFAEFGIFSHVEVQPGQAIGQLLDDGAQMFRILDKMLLSAS